MKTICLAICLLACSCVTSGDLERVAGHVRDMELVLNDETKTTTEVKDALSTAHQRIDEVADEVKERTEGFIKGLGQDGTGGLIGVLAAVGLNMYRNSTRRKALAEVKNGGSS